MGGNKRGDSRKTPLSQQGSTTYRSSSVALLEISANRWVPTSSIRKVQPDVDTPEMVVLTNFGCKNVQVVFVSGSALPMLICVIISA